MLWELCFRRYGVKEDEGGRGQLQPTRLAPDGSILGAVMQAL